MTKLIRHLPTAGGVVGLIAIALFTGCSHGSETTKLLSQTTGGLTVTFTTSHWPPHSGDDTLIVTITDSTTGLPVNDASVVATANMVAPKIPGPTSSGRFEGSGEYDVPVTLIATTYDFDVHIERPSQPAVDLDFPLEAWQ